MEATASTTPTNRPTSDDADERIFHLLQQGFSPSAAVEFEALDLKDQLLTRLRTMGLHEPSKSEMAAIQWQMDRLLASRSAGTMEVDVQLRRDAEGKALVTIDHGNGFYLYVLTEGLCTFAEEEIEALLARTTPVEEGETEFLDEHVEVRLDARGLPVAFVEDGHALADDRTLDVILTPEGRTLVDRPVFVEEHNTAEAMPRASVR